MNIYHFRTEMLVILQIIQIVIIECATNCHKEKVFFVIKISNKSDKEVISIVTELNLIYRGQVGALNDKYLVEKKAQCIGQRHVETVEETLRSHKDVLDYEKQLPLPPRVNREYFNDEDYSKQWYLGISSQGQEQMKYFKMNNVWNQGYTGKGVRIAIVDDGLDHTHKDLKKNYDSNLSKDIIDDDDDPQPKNNIQKHGTRCAGVVASVANNTVCGVGIAYGASIGGIKILDKTEESSFDAIEAQALSFNPSQIDIYSNSWGPSDDGKTMIAPGKLTTAVIEEGVRSGRSGLGSIYLFASGNGGDDDYCSCDGYVMLPETIAISAVDFLDNPPFYAEKCPGIFASAYSSDKIMGVTTTDLNHKCINTFGGTSAATALAAGIIALLLEANPNVTWRDVQHLIANTSTKINPEHESWVKNGVGNLYSVYYGFGVLNPERLIKEATKPTWKTVGKRYNCSRNFDSESGNRSFNKDNELLLRHDSTCCRDSNVCRMEHVTLQMTLHADRLGSVRITLQSPSGTKSPLLEQRKKDKNTTIKRWNFTSLSFWDENSTGKWILNVSSGRGYVESAMIIIYGTEKTYETTNFYGEKDEL